MAQIPQTPTKGWLDMLWEKYHLAEMFDFSACSILEIMAYAVGSFIIGFATKRYALIVCTALLAVILGLWWLDTLAVITIDWVRIKVLLGLDQAAALDSLFKNGITWVQEHKCLSLCAAIGFFVGYKIG